MERILQPLQLHDTAPDVNILSDFYVAGLDRQAFLANFAMPCDLRDGQVVPCGLLRHFSPAAGLISSVRDLARISMALDADQLLDPATEAKMLSPTIEIHGPDRTYGLGWYVQTYQGVRLKWHFGLAIGHSSLRPCVAAGTHVRSGRPHQQTDRGLRQGGGRHHDERGGAWLFLESFVLGSTPIPDSR